MTLKMYQRKQLELEEEFLRLALETSDWSATKAAKRTGTPNTTFGRLIRKHKELSAEWRSKRPVNRFM